jgi:hypothetical protein
MLQRLAAVVPVAAAAVALTACGGSGRLSASAYRGKLAAIARETAVAQGAVEKASGRAKSVKDLEAALTDFGNSERHIASQVQSLKPPENAQSANDELALGASDTSKSAAKAVTAVGKYSSVQAALGYLSSHNGNTKGAHELEDALAKLKQLGYTKGS